MIAATASGGRSDLQIRRFVSALVICASATLIAQTQTPFDLLILNGRVVDGTGAAGVVADIGIRDGRIVAVGRNFSSSAATSKIDAAGLVVSPGFIDVHTHADDIASRPLAIAAARHWMSATNSTRSGRRACRSTSRR